MAVGFPVSLDSFPKPTSTTNCDDSGYELDVLMSDALTGVEKLEVKVGLGSSTPTANTLLRGTGAGTSGWGQLAAGDIPDGLLTRPLHDSVLGAAAASFDVTGISGAYRAIVFQLVARGNTAAPSTTCLLRLNNDSGSNYDYQNMQANNTTVAGFGTVAVTSIVIGAIPAGSATAGIFGQVDAHIGNYAGTVHHKLVNGRSALKASTTTPAAGDLVSSAPSGWWRNAAAITRITLSPAAGSFDVGSRLTIWGLPL